MSPPERFGGSVRKRRILDVSNSGRVVTVLDYTRPWVISMTRKLFFAEHDKDYIALTIQSKSRYPKWENPPK
jgi:hypothetical protein